MGAWNCDAGTSQLESEIPYIPSLQDKHTVSSFSRMSWRELPQSVYKSRGFSDNPYLLMF